jgi:hypothetical protein
LMCAGYEIVFTHRMVTEYIMSFCVIQEWCQSMLLPDVEWSCRILQTSILRSASESIWNLFKGRRPQNETLHVWCDFLWMPEYFLVNLISIQHLRLFHRLSSRAHRRALFNHGRFKSTPWVPVWPKEMRSMLYAPGWCWMKTPILRTVSESI